MHVAFVVKVGLEATLLTRLGLAQKPRPSLGIAARCARAVTGVVSAIAFLSACKAPLVESPPEPQGVAIYPGDDIQAVVDRNPIGTTFIIKAGVHRLQQVIPKGENRFVGQPGAILSGARLLTVFIPSGAYWVADGQTQEGDTAGVCRIDRPRCNRPEDLFIDDVPLEHVRALGEVALGKWYFDYPTDRLYMADDPRGRKVEVSVAKKAFSGAIRDVTIKDVIIEKYATPATDGAIDGSTGIRWIVSGNEIRLNHGMGIRIGPDMDVIGNHIHHQGQLGIGGGGERVLVEDNEIAFNNDAGFSSHWEAGGTKFVYTTGLIVRGNYSHDNHGPGLWTDINNTGTLYEANRVEDNDEAGIFHEVSYAAVIRNNRLFRNGLAAPGRDTWMEGSGILVSSSSDVEVSGNTLIDNANGIGIIQSPRGDGLYGPYLARHIFVHDNTTTQTTGMIGVQQDTGEDSVFGQGNIRFERNTYHLGSNAEAFRWLNGPRSDAEWRAYGLDVDGLFIH